MTARITSPTRRLAAGVLLTAAVAAVSACGGGTSVLNLEVGQCVNTEAESEVSSVPVVDCAETHNGEIYSLPQLPDGDFPGDAAVQQSANELCAGQDFQTYVGVPYQESAIYYSFLVPSTETWDDGDREIVCILTADQSGSASTGSLRGANR